MAHIRRTHMSDNEATGRIKIIHIPRGEAPLAIRRAWVGLELPCLPIMGYPDRGVREKGVLTKEEVGRNVYGVSVPQEEAIAILAQRNSGAAAWWRSKGFPQKGAYFGFSQWEVEAVSGMRYQKIVHVTDEMMGDPDR
jgi:hypothetical protein